MMNRPDERATPTERPSRADEEIERRSDESIEQPTDHEFERPTDEETDDAAAADHPTTDSPPGPAEMYEVLSDRDIGDWRQRWDALQSSFIDDPKGAAEQADALVGDLIERVGQRYQELRRELGERFDRNADTEAMRVAVQRYRAFYKLLVRA